MKNSLAIVLLVGSFSALARAEVVCVPQRQAPQGAQTRSRDLCERQDRGELSVADVVAALGAESEVVASTAAAIVRHEWAELPRELFSLLSDNPLARRRLLEELAVAPRPAAATWAASQAEPRHNRSLNHRLLALAATSQPLTKRHAPLLLEAVRSGELGDGYYYAASRLPEKVADSLVGRIHQALSQGELDVDELGPLLDRLSSRGTRSLLGLAVTLPPNIARRLLRQIYELRPDLVEGRVEAALDGRIPMDSLWLEFGKRLLDRKERVDRVIEILLTSEVPDDRERAFDLLLSARAFDDRALRAIRDEGSEREIQRLIGGFANELPVGYVLGWLGGSPEVAEQMARALATRKVLEPELQRRLVGMLDGFGAVDGHTPLYALTAIVRSGDAENLKAVWSLVLSSRGWPDLLNLLGRRSEPFVQELLVAEVEKQGEREAQPGGSNLSEEQLDTLRLLLVARGDRRELGSLLANAPKRRASFVRRCRRDVDDLTLAQAERLVRAALKCEDLEVAMELLEWSAAVEDGVTVELLWRLWCDPETTDTWEELAETAARVLAAGPKRSPLLAELWAAIDEGPLSDRMSAVPYEILATMPAPLDADGVEVCAGILLKMPLEDAAGEQDRVRRWPDGTSGFPLVAAIANRLRGVDRALAEVTFAAVVEELAGDPRCVRISRQRLSVFWRTLAFDPALQRTLGQITTRLLSLDGGQDQVGQGPATWYSARRYEQLGDYERAERLYRQAGRLLLRLPAAREGGRWLLGERDPGLGEDPHAALAAAPYRMRLLAAQNADDAVAVSQAAALLREFAGYDRVTLAMVKDIPAESGR